MAVTVQRPRREKDFLDIMLQGLQAASAFTNIQKSQAELENIPEAKARIKRQEELQARQERRAFAKDFQEVPEGTKGASLLDVPGEDRRGLFLPRGQIQAQRQARAKLQNARNTFFKDFKQSDSEEPGAVALTAPGDTAASFYIPRTTEAPVDPQDKFTNLGQVQNALKTNKTFQAAQQKVFDASQLTGLAEESAKGNQAAFEQMKVIIGRMNQPGVLTDRDLETLGGSRQLFDVFKRTIQTRVVGDVPKEDIANLTKIGTVAMKSGFNTANKIRSSVIDSFESRFRSAGLPITRSELEGVTNMDALNESFRESLKVQQNVIREAIGLGGAAPRPQAPATTPTAPTQTPVIDQRGKIDIDSYLRGQ